MGRHTGDFLLGTTFLALAMLLAILQGRFGSVLRSPKVPECVSPRADASLWKTESDRRPLPSIPDIPRRPARAVLKNLSLGTRIVVGSLDLSGHRHALSVTIRSINPARDESLPVYRCSIDEIGRWENATSLSARMSSRLEAERGLPVTLICSDGSDRSPSRVFLTPHFVDIGSVHEPTDCRFIGESSRVRVYVDQRLSQLTASGQITEWSKHLTSAAELRALPLVHAWIGAIRDVDHDQKLSIVVTDLDRRSRNASGRAPIYGCIREADFLSDSDFCGDIVYIDPNILGLPTDELAALLTHETAHAAVCSIQAAESFDSVDTAEFGSQHARPQVPSWLSEAVAHFLELQCSDSEAGAAEVSENFQRKVDDFFADPAGSPIVAAEDVLSLNERRSGSRGAATLFLGRWFSTPETLRQFLSSQAALDCKMEELAHEPYADVFRDWTLSLARMSQSPVMTSGKHRSLRFDQLPASDNHLQFSLLGTAFRCFECSEDIASLVIESDVAAQLQISIIEPEANTATIATAVTRN
ncbi:MAG: hypothetical protein WKF77_26080 [Planctomycetaceae bacterium]